MTQIAIWTILVYAFVVALGGAIGYIKAKSKMSLISGLISGAALLAAWFLARSASLSGLGLATLIAGVLVVVFIARLVRTRKFMPAGVMMFLSLGAVVLFALGWMELYSTTGF